MSLTAIIGGTGLSRLEDLEIDHREMVSTPYGSPSSALTFGRLGKRDFVFLARHGERHTIPPHRINYRANLWALHQTGTRAIFAICAVGGIGPAFTPGHLAVPHQLVDYTTGRSQTFFEDDLDHVTHVDFTHPYSARLRAELLAAARSARIDVIDGGVYGCTQGPRLETAAEILRMERDGCDMVGMTGMPEAVLARELGMDYAALAVVANWAAGKTESEITMAEIEANLAQGMAGVLRLLHFLAAIG